MTDLEYMKLAIELASAAKGQTTPNPLVGAVIVRDGSVVGMGAHLKAGEAHAEVHALQMAKEKAEGATMYVTLEPCSHFGKTPPCANLLIEKKIKKVHVATVDPNPLVAGSGIALLQKAGIDVQVGLLKEEADRLNTVFYHYMKTKKPYITLKSASSIDGKTATSTRESKWITGSAAREDVHRYRHIHDAILVGIGTVLADNPSLTTRHIEGGKNPIRIILDHKLRTPIDANVIVDGKAPTWIVTSKDASLDKKQLLLEKGITVLEVNGTTININELLTLLGEKGITSLFVEGGAEVNSSFVAAKAINEIITYYAPIVIGGRLAPSIVGGHGFENMADVLQLEFESLEKIGKDIKIVSRIKE